MEIASGPAVVPLICALIRNAEGGAPLQSSICSALYSLLVFSSNVDLLVSAGGIPALIAGLQRHVNDPTAAEKFCLCLARVAAGASHRAALISAGAVTVAAAVFNRYGVGIAPLVRVSAGRTVVASANLLHALASSPIFLFPPSLKDSYSLALVPFSFFRLVSRTVTRSL